MLRWMRGIITERTASETRSYNRMPNVNIPETENIKLVWTMYTSGEEKKSTSQEKYGHGCTGEEKMWRSRRRWFDNSREDMNNLK